MQKNILLIAIGIAASVILSLLVFSGSLTTEKYELFVDPLIDKQSLFVMARVSIQNTGYMPLTNVIVNWGDGNLDRLGTLKPNQKVILSPPDDNLLNYVIVTTDQDILIKKFYREVPKMPGMIGS